MHIKISKSSLSEALNNVQAVVGGKATLQILQNVLIEAKGKEVKLTCSDLDTTLVANAECEVVGEGATTLPAKLLSSAVGKVVDGIIEIDVDGQDTATVSAGTSVFTVKGMAAKEFPTIPSPDDGLTCTMSSGALREMLRKTSFASCKDDTRRTLQGTLLDFGKGGTEIKAVGTDGRRLALLNCTLDTANGFSGQFILPAKAVDMLQKKLPKEGDAELVTAKGQLLVKTARLTFLTKLIDDVFPVYEKVLPKNEGSKVTISRVELVGAFDRISVFTSSTDAPCVVMSFADNRLTLNSGDTEVGSAHDEIPVKYEGDAIDIKFNPQYIKEVLTVMDEDEIDMSISNSAAPAVIRKSGVDDFTYVVMPLRK